MRTTCRKGHDLTDEANVITKPDGSRQCRPCQRRANAEAAKRRYHGQEPTLVRLPVGQDECDADGCDRPRRVAGRSGRSRYCAAHWVRHHTYGEPFADVPIGLMRGVPLPEQRARLGTAPSAPGE